MNKLGPLALGLLILFGCGGSGTNVVPVPGGRPQLRVTNTLDRPVDLYVNFAPDRLGIDLRFVEPVMTVPAGETSAYIEVEKEGIHEVVATENGSKVVIVRAFPTLLYNTQTSGTAEATKWTFTNP